jgi:hypothetical protein
VLLTSFIAGYLTSLTYTLLQMAVNDEQSYLLVVTLIDVSILESKSFEISMALMLGIRPLHLCTSFCGVMSTPCPPPIFEYIRTSVYNCWILDKDKSVIK